MDVYAVHHVRVGRGVYTPGEYIDASIPADQLERLLRLGAVRTAGDQGILPPQKEAEPIKVKDVPEQAPDAPEAAEDAESEDQAEDDAEGEDEADEEADFEPPTIDASDGLVSAKKTGAKAGKGGKKG